MRRAEVGVVAALAVLALVAALLVPTYPNYDTYFHLVWGRELMHGMKPDFEAYAAPTEHPSSSPSAPSSGWWAPTESA